MVLKIGDFEIYVYDKNNAEHNHLKYVLNNDSDFRKYVTKQLDENLQQEQSISSEDSLQFGQSYLVKYKGDFVGYIKLENLDFGGNVNIQYAVSPEFRNQNLATRILKTISDYILENKEEVKKIKGVIEKSNYPSRTVAQNAEFLEEDRDDFYIYFSKSRR